MTDLTEYIEQSVSVSGWKSSTEDEMTYILAESAINPRVQELAEDRYSTDETRLYWGEMGKAHASISPYLLPLSDWSVFEKQMEKLTRTGTTIKTNC